MANNVAPVCNLPNIGQVPALQPGRMYPSIPRAQDLPSAIQAANALGQLVALLLQPGIPGFTNNVAPTNTTITLIGTPGINGAAGADGSPGAKGKAGEKGENAKQPSWVLSGVKTQNVKVENPDDRDQFVVVKRISEIGFRDSSQSNQTLILQMSGKGNG